MEDSFSQGVHPRFGEINKFMPVFFVFFIIVLLYSQYVFLHCLRLMQLDLPANERDVADARKGFWEMLVLNFFTGLMFFCLVKCILVHPGAIPSGAGWEHGLEEGGAGVADAQSEKKHTGEKRWCKWCLKNKPDRCHHCRTCGMCVLRMDHHCPWVYNCIGFRNHKYFVLLIIYAVINLLIIDSTMFETIWWSTREDVAVSVMVMLLASQTLAVFLSVLTSSFLSFHIWLTLRAMTTVEFCEKSLKREGYDSSTYSRGLYANICAVFGDNPFLWLLPCSLPSGDGMQYGDRRPSPPLALAPKAASAVGPPARSRHSQSSESSRVRQSEQFAQPLLHDAETEPRPKAAADVAG